MILEKVRKTIKRYNLVNNNDRVLIGVSGGPDSVVLLYTLNSLKKELKADLYVAHLDHMLRNDSYRDMEFVEGLAQRLKLPMFNAQINVKELAKEGGSLEEIARNARLGFFFNVAKKIKAKKIALGHNFDDQAETVLMRILRGTGLCGLIGMLPKRSIADFEIIRPLIEVKRKEIEKFLKRKKIKARLDISNRQDLYFRNKIRNRLLPLLEREYNKNIKEVLASLAQSAGTDYDYLQGKAVRILSQMRPAKSLKFNKLQNLHPAIQRLLFRQLIASLKGNTRRIVFKHIKEIEDLLLNRPINAIVDLPKGISVAKKKRALFFYQR